MTHKLKTETFSQQIEHSGGVFFFFFFFFFFPLTPLFIFVAFHLKSFPLQLTNERPDLFDIKGP